jgi:hypothetical protein
MTIIGRSRTRQAGVRRQVAAIAVALAIAAALAAPAPLAAATCAEAEPAADSALVREIETSLCPASDDPLLVVSPERLRAVAALGDRGRTALLTMARSPAHDRVCAIEYLVEMREPRAVCVLRPLAASTAELAPLRGRAVLGLAGLGDRQSVAIAASLLDPGDRALFRAGLETLATLDAGVTATMVTGLLAGGRYPEGYWALLITRLAETRERVAIDALIAESVRVDAGRGAHVARALIRVGTLESLDGAVRVYPRLEGRARALVAIEIRRALHALRPTADLTRVEHLLTLVNARTAGGD